MHLTREETLNTEVSLFGPLCGSDHKYDSTFINNIYKLFTFSYSMNNIHLIGGVVVQKGCGAGFAMFRQTAASFWCYSADAGAQKSNFAPKSPPPNERIFSPKFCIISQRFSNKKTFFNKLKSSRRDCPHHDKNAFDIMNVQFWQWHFDQPR